MRPKSSAIDLEKPPKPGSIRRNLFIKSSEKEINVISNDSSEHLRKADEAAKSKAVELNTEQIQVLKSPRTRKSSVSCQASTLGRRNESGSSEDESLNTFVPLKSIKKSSPRNALTKPSSEGNDHIDKVVGEENVYEQNKKKDVVFAANAINSFKADGYTLAYEARKRKQQLSQKKHSV